ncbi:hypothetical protein BA011_31770 (plasmid) [Rhizobium leguminosarum]|uniref:Uncharacterized protein n=1 Tax=Rhizobium leguminosarum TaxID=384 RepID=A0A1B1CLD1_RHILE|nr:hypothetical protein BA011_31770 [Rhizobium leguminosarum]
MNVDLPAIGKADMGSGRGKQRWKAGGNALFDACQQLAQAASPLFRQLRLPELPPDGFAVEFEIGFGGEHGEEKIRLLRQGEFLPRRQQSRSSEQAQPVRQHLPDVRCISVLTPESQGAQAHRPIKKHVRAIRGRRIAVLL